MNLGLGWKGVSLAKKLTTPFLLIITGIFATLLAISCLICFRESLTEVIAVGTLINTCIVTYVGVRQYINSLDQRRLEEAKHRAELFDRRFAVFQATQKVLSKVLQEGACDYNDVHEFTSWTQQAYFLFDDQIHSYLLEIRSNLIGMASTSRQLRDGSNPERRHEVVQENHELLVWLTDQLNMENDGLFLRFRPYLRH